MEQDPGKGYCYARRESNLKHALYGGNFFTRPPTDTPRRTISPCEGYLLTRIQRAAGVVSIARIEGAHSDRAASASTETMPPPRYFPS